MNKITITILQHNERNAEQDDNKTKIELSTLENDAADSKEHIENEIIEFSENKVQKSYIIMSLYIS